MVKYKSTTYSAAIGEKDKSIEEAVWAFARTTWRNCRRYLSTDTKI